MSLKKLVNDIQIWKAFDAYLDERIAYAHKQLEMAEGNSVYHWQGHVRELRNMKMLREKVNNG